MLRFFFLVFFTCVIIPLSFSQNLAINPSFEERDSLKTDLMLGNDSFAKYGVRGWYNPTQGWNKPYVKSSVNYFGTSDYYCWANKNTLHAKLIDPHSGNACAGLLLYWDGKELVEDYVADELIEPMKAGQKYIFSMTLAVSHDDTFENLDMGVYFSDTAIQAQTDVNMIDLVPQLHIKLYQFGVAWKIYSVEYTAVGGEKYFSIGYFRKELTNPYPSSNGHHPYCYNMIDDVSIEPVNAIASGKTLVKDNINFESGDSTLKINSYSVLDEIISEMKKQPKLKVEIDGHTDNTGTPGKNQALSEARAPGSGKLF